MKILLVLSSDKIFKHISLCVRPLGFELIRYFHVLKAMDNVDEIDPQAIIISAVDFPRHWKVMVQFFRSERPKDSCPIILLKGDNFCVEEISKASFLGVSGTVFEVLSSSEIDRLQTILSRHLPVEEKRRTRRLYVEPHQKFGFVFSHPKNNKLVTGRVRNISGGGLSFQADNQTLMHDIALNTTLLNCSFRAEDAMLSPVCRLARTGRIVSMEFLFFPKMETQILNTCIEKFLQGKLGEF